MRASRLDHGHARGRKVMSRTARIGVALAGLVILLIVALLVQATTDSNLATWIAVGAFFVVMVARWFLLAR